jgi:hypothetical protein
VVRDVVREELVRERPAMLATRLVSVAEYAAARSISESKVRHAIARGDLLTQRIGTRSVRIPADAEIATHDRRTATATERAAARLGLRGGSR